MIKVISIIIFIWNYVFERSFNLFDVAVFSYTWNSTYTWSNWQFWAILVPAMIVSAIGTDISNKFKALHGL